MHRARSDSSCQALRAWKEHQSCEYTTGFRRIDLQSISRSIFKQKAGARPTSEDYDEALSALRAVMDQRERAECSSCSEDPERGLTVTAMSCYAPDDSDRRRSHLFTYRVTVQNNGPEPVRCVGRHWYIIGEGCAFNTMMAVMVRVVQRMVLNHACMHAPEDSGVELEKWAPSRDVA